MVCEKTSKSNDTNIFAKSSQGGWIPFLDLEVKQVLFYIIPQISPKIPHILLSIWGISS